MAGALLGSSLAQQRDHLVIGLPIDITIPDLHKGSGLPAFGAVAQMADVLVLERNGEIVPWLAESWEYSDDGRSLIFKIRDGVLAHDGSEITAEDVAWSINRFMDISVGRSSLQVVTNVDTLSGNRVQVTTDEPFAPLLSTFTYTLIGVYSKTAYDAAGSDDAFSIAPVGPGPYKFVEWIPGQRMVLEAFDGYWAGAPAIKTIEFRAILDESSRIAALEAGEIDVIHAFSPFEAERLADNPEIQVFNPPSAGFIRLNMHTQHPPFDNPLVRRAIAHGIDREAISAGVFLGTAPIAHSLVPSGAFGYTDEFDVYDYDPQRARELLAEAGMPNLSFTLAFGSGRYLLDSEVVTVVQAQLAEIGVNVKIQAMEWAQFSELIRQPLEVSSTEMTLTWWRSVNADPDSAIGVFTEAELPPGNNPTYYVSEEFERLYMAQQTEPGQEQRLQIIRDLQEVLMSDLPAIPMYNQPQLWAARADVVGFDETITALSTMQPLHNVTIK
jgi:peptide/nickel transport system substrate-binding protein/oligopeptide transport system substrate-binding protein